MGHNSTDDYLKIVDEIADLYDIPDDTISALMGFVKSLYRSDMSNKYSAPMLYIGMYIAVASLGCILAMVADLLHGLHRRKLWFPCRVFRINSFYLAVISVAMKLPLDLSGSMPGDVDQAGKLGSMAFMCTMMANLLPCLATMNNNELLSNITALFILVITLVVNVCIQITTGVVTYKENDKILLHVAPKYKIKSPVIIKHRNTVLATIYVTFLLALLILHVSSCLAILKSKKIIELKCKQGNDIASKEIQQSEAGRLLAFETLKKHVSNHWIMAGSGSPQFITACFPTSSASGVICVLVTVLHTLTMYWTSGAIFKTKDWDSDYSWSMIVILVVQFFGVVIGTIAPLSRCFATLSFNVSSKVILKHFEIFDVKSYWSSKLHDWKRSSMKLPFSSHMPHPLKVVIENLKKLILNIWIQLQELVVVACKITALPFVFMMCVLYCFRSLGGKSDNHSEQNKDLRQYVLQLEDETELADRTLERLSKSVDRLIKKGEKHKPENLIALIKKKYTKEFSGVEKIYYNHVPTLLSKEYQEYCWSLPVVTLTTIAVSLYEIDKNVVESLRKSVRKGLEYVKHVEESLNVTDDYVSIRKEAETLWKEVDVDVDILCAETLHKWLGNRLRFDCQTAGQIVQWFRDTSKKICPKEGSNEVITDESLLHKSICANSMYHITKTILLSHHDNIDEVRQQELFGNLSTMISDILAACLTNIPQAIIEKCHTSAIEKREASVKEAARLLGETKEIMEILSSRDIPDMNPSDLPFISKWQAYLKKNSTL